MQPHRSTRITATATKYTILEKRKQQQQQQQQQQRFINKEKAAALKTTIRKTKKIKNNKKKTFILLTTTHATLTRPPADTQQRMQQVKPVANRQINRSSQARDSRQWPNELIQQEITTATAKLRSYFTQQINDKAQQLLEATAAHCKQSMSLGSWCPRAVVYITLLLLSAICSLCTASPCDSNSWWDPVRDRCIPCTVCQGEMIPLRPCQLHRDTICGSIYDLKIDWVVLAKTEPNWKERRKSDDDYGLQQLHHQAELQHLTQEQLQQLHEQALNWDWQTGALFLAVLACLLFFIVAACILIHHMRQWRRMEQRLDQDVEELSTKLMAKLAEVQSLEGGTFFIGNADALRVPTTLQSQHVLLPEKPAKHQERRILKTLQPGNVYIEENGSKG